MRSGWLAIRGETGNQLSFFDGWAVASRMAITLALWERRSSALNFRANSTTCRVRRAIAAWPNSVTKTFCLGYENCDRAGRADSSRSDHLHLSSDGSSSWRNNNARITARYSTKSQPRNLGNGTLETCVRASERGIAFCHVSAAELGETMSVLTD